MPRSQRSGSTAQPRFSTAAVAVLALLLSACVAEVVPDRPESRASTGAAPGAGAQRVPRIATATTSPPRPTPCRAPAEADRGSLEGALVWARFCPGRNGRTQAAHVPVAALTSYVGLLRSIRPRAQRARAARDSAPLGCRPSFGRTYRLQLGYADGRVAEVVGHTDPSCPGRLLAVTDEESEEVRGPARLGVFGVAMLALGRQAADRLAAPRDPSGQATTTVTPSPLTCPVDAQSVTTVVTEGRSADSVDGWLFGGRTPMLMPATAVRGLVCVWPYRRPQATPEVRDLTTDEAERGRIGLHAVDSALADCVITPDPTTVLVVEDAFGTRRAIAIDDSCAASVSGSTYGARFAWLER